MMVLAPEVAVDVDSSVASTRRADVLDMQEACEPGRLAEREQRCVPIDGPDATRLIRARVVAASDNKISG